MAGGSRVRFSGEEVLASWGKEVMFCPGSDDDLELFEEEVVNGMEETRLAVRKDHADKYMNSYMYISNIFLLMNKPI